MAAPRRRTELGLILLAVLSVGATYALAAFGQNATIPAGIGPFLEEVVYRGALFRPLRKTASVWSVLVVTSVLFGLAHVEWQRVVPIALLGMALCLLRISSGSLVPSALMHGTFNGVSFWAMRRTGPTPPASTASRATLPRPDWAG